MFLMTWGMFSNMCWSMYGSQCEYIHEYIYIYIYYCLRNHCTWPCQVLTTNITLHMRDVPNRQGKGHFRECSLERQCLTLLHCTGSLLNDWAYMHALCTADRTHEPDPRMQYACDTVECSQHWQYICPLRHACVDLLSIYKYDMYFKTTDAKYQLSLTCHWWSLCSSCHPGAHVLRTGENQQEAGSCQEVRLSWMRLRNCRCSSLCVFWTCFNLQASSWFKSRIRPHAWMRRRA